MKKQKSKNKKILILGILILLVAILFLIFTTLNNKYINKDIIKTTKHLITIQEGYEKNLKTKGYTVDNPNVILDPYKISPLTALVLFETENEVSPKVTITGKDDISLRPVRPISRSTLTI